MILVLDSGLGCFYFYSAGHSELLGRIENVGLLVSVPPPSAAPT